MASRGPGRPAEPRESLHHRSRTASRLPPRPGSENQAWPWVFPSPLQLWWVFTSPLWLWPLLHVAGRGRPITLVITW